MAITHRRIQEADEQTCRRRAAQHVSITAMTKETPPRHPPHSRRVKGHTHFATTRTGRSDARCCLCSLPCHARPPTLSMTRMHAHFCSHTTQDACGKRGPQTGGGVWWWNERLAQSFCIHFAVVLHSSDGHDHPLPSFLRHATRMGWITSQGRW
jgi:hypothetical protein